MYEYKCKIIKIVDGDTVDIDLDLGFGVWLRDERVRIMGIDTPESRTSDKIEKVFGLAAKPKTFSILSDVLLSGVSMPIIRTLSSRSQTPKPKSRSISTVSPSTIFTILHLYSYIVFSFG